MKISRLLHNLSKKLRNAASCTPRPTTTPYPTRVPTTPPYDEEKADSGANIDFVGIAAASATAPFLVPGAAHPPSAPVSPHTLPSLSGILKPRKVAPQVYNPSGSEHIRWGVVGPEFGSLGWDDYTASAHQPSRLHSITEEDLESEYNASSNPTSPKLISEQVHPSPRPSSQRSWTLPRWSFDRRRSGNTPADELMIGDHTNGHSATLRPSSSEEPHNDSVAAASPASPYVIPNPARPPSRPLSVRSAPLPSHERTALEPEHYSPGRPSISYKRWGVVGSPHLSELILDSPAPDTNRLRSIAMDKLNLTTTPANTADNMDTDTDETAALRAEIEMLTLITQRHQDEILKLSHSLEREHHINFHLQRSRFCRPRKLKKHIKRLAAQLHAKEAEVEEWREKFARLAWTAGLREEIAGTRNLLEGVVGELEGQAGRWRERIERVGRMAREVEREGRGLGMWWVAKEVEERPSGGGELDVGL